MRYPFRLSGPSRRAFPSRLAALVVPALLFAVGCAPHVLKANGGTAVPATDADAISASRVLVKLWTTPGTFSETRIAEVLHDRLYVAGLPRGMHAYDGRTGQRLWSYTGQYPVDYPPTEDAGKIFILESGQAVAVRDRDGVELTRHRTRLAALSPLFPTRLVWTFASTNERVIGIAAGSGAQKWYVAVDHPILHIIEAGADKLIALTRRGTLYAISRSAHEVLWHVRLPGNGWSSLAFDGARVYVGSTDRYFYALDLERGDIVGNVLIGMPPIRDPLATDQAVFAATTDGRIHALDPETLRVKYVLEDAERVLTTTVKHTIFLRRAGGRPIIVVADAQTGAEIARMSAQRYALFAADPDAGVFYAVTREGEIAAVADRDVAEAFVAQPSSAASPEAAVAIAIRKAFNTAKRGEIEVFLHTLTPESEAFMREQIRLMGEDKAKERLFADKLVVVSVNVVGASAEAKTQVTRNDKVTEEILYLRKVEDAWALDLMRKKE